MAGKPQATGLAPRRDPDQKLTLVGLKLQRPTFYDGRA
jgi:hypothetical protein